MFVVCLLQRDLGLAGLKGSLVDPQPLVAAVQATQLGPASGALLDADVHRILVHRRAYLKQQRAFDRACVGTEQFEFDPTQVKPIFANTESATSCITDSTFRISLMQYVAHEPVGVLCDVVCALVLHLLVQVQGRTACFLVSL